MRISVLQQNPGFWYDYNREEPTLNFLKASSEKTIDRCFEMLKAATSEGAELAVTIVSLK